jgi:hypothetical protein
MILVGGKLNSAEGAVGMLIILQLIVMKFFFNVMETIYEAETISEFSWMFVLMSISY